MNKENNVVEIDLFEVWGIIKRNILAIILAAVICAGAAGVYSFFIATPQYQSTAKLYVLGSSTSITSLADVQLGSSLTNDYRELITGRPVVMEVKRNLRLEYTYKEMLEIIAVDTPQDTRIVKISVTTDDPEKSKMIANELAMVSKREISHIMDTDPPSLAERAVAERNAVKPEKAKNIMLGFIAGLVVSVLFFVITALKNDYIRRRDDVERVLGLTVLAEIPLEGGKKGIAADKPVKKSKKKGK